MLITSMFFIVFVKMEVRRSSYRLLKISKEHKKLRDNFRDNSIRYAKTVQPKRVQSYAESKLTMMEAKKGQIILMTGNNIAIRQ